MRAASAPLSSDTPGVRFAYGQTGSGKSFTLFGPEGDASIYAPAAAPSATAGVIPRAVRDLFAQLAAKPGKREVFCSFVQVQRSPAPSPRRRPLTRRALQIYNEHIFDLLRDPHRQLPLALHETSAQGVWAEGLSEFAVRSRHDCLQLLRRGDDNRAIRHTHMNEFSSRSHGILQLLVSAAPAPVTAVVARSPPVDSLRCRPAGRAAR